MHQAATYSQAILGLARRVRRKYPKGRNMGCCFDASAELLRLTEQQLGLTPRASIQFGWYSGHLHTWFEFVDERGERMVVDVTVDQFDPKLPAILFGAIENLPQYAYDEGEDSE